MSCTGFFIPQKTCISRPYCRIIILNLYSKETKKINKKKDLSCWSYDLLDYHNQAENWLWRCWCYVRSVNYAYQICLSPPFFLFQHPCVRCNYCTMKILKDKRGICILHQCLNEAYFIVPNICSMENKPCGHHRPHFSVSLLWNGFTFWLDLWTVQKS